MRAVLNAGRTIAEARAAMERELTRIVEEPLPEAELEKAKTLALTFLARARQTPTGLALALVRAAVQRGTPQAAADDPARYADVSAADVARVARAALRPSNVTTIEYLPR